MRKSTEKSVLDKLSKNQEIENKCLNSFVNPYSYMVIRKGYTGINHWYVDGQFAVWFFNLFGFNIKRRSFDMTSLAPVVFSFCESKGRSLAIVGASQKDIEEFVDVVLGKYPKLNIVFYRNGFFNSPVDLENTRQQIIQYNPDFVICGMGAGKQENFLIKLRSAGWLGTGYTCGGFIHQTASAGVRYYPSWADKFHLRWLYRMMDEPKLIKRYLKYYPIFPFVFVYDFFRR